MKCNDLTCGVLIDSCSSSSSDSLFCDRGGVVVGVATARGSRGGAGSLMDSSAMRVCSCESVSGGEGGGVERRGVADLLGEED